MQNDNEKFKNKFLNREIIMLSINGAFQHARIYHNNVSSGKKLAFLSFLRIKLTEYRDEYNKKISEEKHVCNIQNFADEISKNYSNILNDGRFRIGITQKLLNLYLKYCWVLGWISEPPHCPFDSKIIGILGKKIGVGCKKWTIVDSVECYQQWISTAQQLANKKTIAEWELVIFNFDL